MKNLVKVIGLSTVLLFSGLVAAETKVAIVDVMSVLQQMPQRETVGKALDKEFEARAKVLQKQEGDANAAAEKLKKDGMTLSSSEKTKLNKVISDFEGKAREFSLDYRKRENEEAGKLLAKIEDAVVAVAKGNYDLVLKAEAAFYAVDSVDITDKVLDQVKK